MTPVVVASVVTPDQFGGGGLTVSSVVHAAATSAGFVAVAQDSSATAAKSET